MHIRFRRPMGSLIVVLGLVLVSCKGKEPIGPGPTTLEPPVPKSTGPIAFVSDRDGTEQIYLANEDGSLITPLTAGSYPAWSRDGQRLAFSRAREIYVINVDGSGLRRVVSGYEPAWSPDGQMLVFRGATRWGIDVVDVNGSNHRALHDHDFGALSPAWSPDGRRIAFAVGSFVGDGMGLWVMNADGSDPLWIGRGDEELPEWSPDGSEIAFVSAGPIEHLEVVRPDGTGRRLVTGQALFPDWAPDGRLIFTKNPSGNWYGPGQRIFIRDGGAERQLIPDLAAPMRPAYSDRQAVWRR
jgi:TolB protein